MIGAGMVALMASAVPAPAPEKPGAAALVQAEPGSGTAIGRAAADAF